MVLTHKVYIYDVQLYNRNGGTIKHIQVVAKNRGGAAKEVRRIVKHPLAPIDGVAYFKIGGHFTVEPMEE